MCGRFVASRPVEEIVDQFEINDVRLPLELLPGPRFNVSPQDDVLAVREAVRNKDPEGPSIPERRLSAYRWGLVPYWAKEPGAGARSFNARAETLLDKPMFKNAVSKRRCIIPADAFYEWQKLPSPDRRRRSQPWCFRPADGELIAFAGLYELWHDDKGIAHNLSDETLAFDDGWLRTCTLITTEANDLMAPIHDRMPVMLQKDQYEQWLSPGPLEEGELRHLLLPPPDDFLTAYRVGPEVGNSRAEGPELAQPISSEEAGDA